LLAWFPDPMCADIAHIALTTKGNSLHTQFHRFHCCNQTAPGCPPQGARARNHNACATGRHSEPVHMQTEMFLGCVFASAQTAAACTVMFDSQAQAAHSTARMQRQPRDTQEGNAQAAEELTHLVCLGYALELLLRICSLVLVLQMQDVGVSQLDTMPLIEQIHAKLAGRSIYHSCMHAPGAIA